MGQLASDTAAVAAPDTGADTRVVTFLDAAGRVTLPTPTTTNWTRHGTEPLRERVLIYALRDPETGACRYVGKTCLPLDVRLRGHLADFRSPSWKRNWIKSLVEKNLKPTISVLEELLNPTVEEWTDAEQFWIKVMRLYGCNLTNLCEGGEGGRHAPESIERMRLAKSHLSEETLAKMRAFQLTNTVAHEAFRKVARERIGKKKDPAIVAKTIDGLRGQKRTPEQIERIRQGILKSITPEIRAAASLRMRNRVISPATREKMSKSQKGRPMSDETRLKYSLVKLGVPWSAARRAAGGKKQTEETKRKISEKAKARFSDPAWVATQMGARQQISKTLKGRFLGRKNKPESIEKMRATRMANKIAKMENQMHEVAP